MNTDQNFPLHRWMEATPQLDNLSLSEMTLPGTHNAGCDWNASFALIPGKNWLACQDVPFFAQLNRGARALDVRLTYRGEAQGLNRFRFAHDKYLSSRTLGDLLGEVEAFLEASPNEFIILDFHELKSEKGDFNHAEFKRLLMDKIGNRIIPSENLHLTTGQLKQLSSLQRIMVAAPMTWETRDKRIQSQIPHKWIGKALVSNADLHGYIKEVMNTPISSQRPWSLSATVYTAGGPQRILNELDAWFDPAQTDWAKKCNIINFDFIKNSNIVRFCQMANLEKVSDKSQWGIRLQAGDGLAPRTLNEA